MRLLRTQHLGKEQAISGCLMLNAKGMKWLWKIVMLTLVQMLILTVNIPMTQVSNVVDVSVTFENSLIEMMDSIISHVLLSCRWRILIIDEIF